jgi:cell division protein FtsQ
MRLLIPRRIPRIRFGLAAAALSFGLSLGAGAWLVRSGRAEAGLAALADAGAKLGISVQSVSVEGRERESRAAILAALGVSRGAPLFGVDLGAAKTRLEALPWVHAADVQRILPDRLFIHLEERHPLAFWQRQGKLELLADDGKVVRGVNLAQYGALVVLVGDDVPKFGAALLSMLATEPALAPHVAAAVRVGGRRWNLRLDSGIDVALPEENPETAWHRLAALEKSDSLLDRDILAVDLRLPDRLVVKLPPEPPKASPKKGKPAGKTT